MRALSYARVSTADQVQVQKQGAKQSLLPETRSLLELATAGPPMEAVVIMRLDRLARTKAQPHAEKKGAKEQNGKLSPRTNGRHH